MQDAMTIIRGSSRMIAVCISVFIFCFATLAQETRNLTPLQIEIEKQQQRLGSSDQEDRRDAVMKLGSMRLPAASRAILPALNDVSPIIRATAAKAILSIGAEESVAALLPLLQDKHEFVRHDTPYALGLTRSRSASAALSERLLNDMEYVLRGAAAVALGQTADEPAVIALLGPVAMPL